MRPHDFVTLWLPIPALAFALTLAGCTTATDSASTHTVAPIAHGQKERPKKTKIESTGWATIKGKVTFDGDPPPMVDFVNVIRRYSEKDHCLQGDTTDPTWRVGPDKGIANVVVWLKAPEGTYFTIPPDENKFWPDEVVIDQPFCSFEPHVSVVFPAHYDGQKLQRTGQKFVFANGSAINKCARFKGSPEANSGENITLPPAKTKEFALKPDTEVIRIVCDLRTWMSAFVWAFDHPYAAVTKGGEETWGKYEIKVVPAGVELELVAWHEAKPNPYTCKIGPLKDGEVKELSFSFKK